MRMLNPKFPALIVLAFAGATAQTEAAAPAEVLHALFHEYWEFHMEAFPTYASILGDRRWNDRWTDYSFDAIHARHRKRVEFLERARAIDPALLEAADRVNRALFERELADAVEEHGYGIWRLALDHREGVQTTDTHTRWLRFQTEEDYADWNARMEAFPRLVKQTIAVLRAGIATGITQPRIIIERIPAQLAKQIVTDPDDSPFLAPYEKVPSELSEERAAALRAEARDLVQHAIVPAFEEFDVFLHDEYLPACRETLGISGIPNGAACYAFLARKFTTTELSPQQIHELGLREVDRIRGEMEMIRRKTEFAGSLAAFFEFMRTDPRFFHQDGEELLGAYRALAKRIDPLIVRVLRKLPRMPYGVDPIPGTIAPDTTTAYYLAPAADGSRAGIYYVNLYQPESRPKWEMVPLSLHEAVPGHHLQIALAHELGEIPEFRRYGGYTAFVEGWGLYAEYLGEELGLYDDPYDKFGQLTYEMWRAVRLVVDTGMHTLGWSRQAAIDFFKANAPKTELDIVNEIDRYIGMPGQALAYKIGEMKFKELRARAAAAFGERFDVRDYHDLALSQGAVTLDVLERMIDEWLVNAVKPFPSATEEHNQ